MTDFMLYEEVTEALKGREFDEVLCVPKTEMSRGEAWALAEEKGRTSETNLWRKAHTENYWVWVWSDTDAREPPPTSDVDARAAALVNGGWYQTSHKYRALVRIPPELACFEILCRHRPKLARGLMERLEAWSCEALLHNAYPFERRDGVPVDVFQAYKALGGGPIDARARTPISPALLALLEDKDG